MTTPSPTPPASEQVSHDEANSLLFRITSDIDAEQAMKIAGDAHRLADYIAQQRAKSAPAPAPVQAGAWTPEERAFRWDGFTISREGTYIWFKSPDGEQHGWPQMNKHEAMRLEGFLSRRADALSGLANPGAVKGVIEAARLAIDKGRQTLSKTCTNETQYDAAMSYIFGGLLNALSALDGAGAGAKT